MKDLRDFVDDLCLTFTIRVAADMLGLKREALRKFVLGKTEHPRESTRRKIGTAYLLVRRGRAGAVREARSEVPLPTPDEFRLIFKDREDALRKFAALFAQLPRDEEGNEATWAAATHVIMQRMANHAFAEGTVLYRPADDEDTKKRGAAKKTAGPAKKKRPARPRTRKARDAEGEGK